MALTGAGLLVAAVRRKVRARRASQKTVEEQTEAEPAPQKTGLLVMAATALMGFVAANLLAPLSGRYVGQIATFVDQQLGVRPLTIAAQSWPADPGCDVSTAAAMPKGGPSPDEIRFSHREDPRKTVVTAGGGSWESGYLTFSLSATRVVHLESVEPVVLSVQKKPDLSWVLTKDRACGPGTGVFLRLDLDTSRLFKVTPKGVFPEAALEGPTVRGAEVSVDKPLRVGLQVTSCEAAYTWYLRIRYLSEGVPGELTIGSPEAPLRSAGGVRGVPIHDIRAGEPGAGYRPIDTGKKTSGRCEADR